MPKVLSRRSVFLFIILLLVASFFFIVKNEAGIKNFFGIKKLPVEKIIKYFPFSAENSLLEWEEKILRGRVIYRVEKGDAISYVRAESDKTASSLYYRIKVNINQDPVISWKWRVDKFPERNLPEKIESIKEEDFAARVYVIFPAAFFTNSKVIEYIWSETLPAGTSGQSGYSKNIKVLVLEMGQAPDWRFEKRVIAEDYLKLFGEKPRLNIGAVAFMTDADSTKTAASAVYDEITVGYE